MAGFALGLDIGSSSIGWAVLNKGEQRIVAAGVRVYPEGVDRDQQGGEKSKSAQRRTARGMRRQIARRTHRKRELRQLLIQIGLLPDATDALNEVLALNPYPLRARALDEKLSPSEIGRILVHLGHRRGFLSNRKADRARAKEAKGMLAEISALASTIEGAGCRTLGEYLNSIDHAFDHRHRNPEPTEMERRRGRLADTVRRLHTRRDMYIEEFEEIWKAQRRHYPELLTDDLRIRLYNPIADGDWVCKGLIFGQRKMYWPKSVVGRCELEPRLKRCPKADRAAQRFRLLQEVNNIRITDALARVERSLTDDERSTLINYLSKAKERSFDQIRKKLNLADHVRFNYERAERKKLKGHETDAGLGAKTGIGKDWENLSEPRKDAIVDILINEDHEEVALQRLMTECDLSNEEAQRALGVNLPDGYMSYSRQAIEKLLPHLERGLHLMAEDARNSALHAAGYLRPDEREVGQRQFLPPAPDLPNPLVRQAIVEVRKIVNGVIREFGKFGRDDAIHVELAREAKKSLDERKQIRFDNASREGQREDAANEIQRMGFKASRASINRYLLWREQEEYCVYCGKKISQAQLFGGDVDIDHILPRWRSLDNSMANKAVCHRSCNDDKGDRTPREWLEDADPVRYERVLRLADGLPYNKRRKFIQKDIVLEDFVERQLKDTQYITRLVTQYLKCLGARIITPRGQMTAELRHFWGLNTILDPQGRGEKNRADHRHHAIDAVVIALTDHKRLFALANDRGKDVKLPWPLLRDNVAGAVGAINVSHRAQRRLYGALHEDTFYGPTLNPWKAGGPGERPWAKGWTEREGAYVRRKPITEIKNAKHLEKVRDAAAREILHKHLRQQNIDPDQSGDYPKTVFKGDNTPKMPSGVPIKKVRMIEESATFRGVSERRYFQYVKPGNNHHIVYRAVGDGPTEKWIAEVVTMWDAARRARSGRPVIDRSDKDGARFVMSLAIGETFQIQGDGCEPRLCVVRKMTQKTGATPPRFYYRPHQDARDLRTFAKDLERLKLSPRQMQKGNARKALVDPLGRIRWAND